MYKKIRIFVAFCVLLFLLDFSLWDIQCGSETMCVLDFFSLFIKTRRKAPYQAFFLALAEGQNKPSSPGPKLPKKIANKALIVRCSGDN